MAPANNEHPDIKATISIGIAGLESDTTSNERFNSVQILPYTMRKKRDETEL